MPINVVPPRCVASAAEAEHANNDGYFQRCPSTTEPYKILQSLMSTFTFIGNMGWKAFHKTGCWVYLTRSFVYGILVMTFLSTNVLRWCLMFSSDDPFNIKFIIKLIIVTWALEALSHTFGFFFASISFKRLPEFLLEWNRLHVRCVKSTADFKKQTNICTGMIWLLISLNMAFNIYMTFYTHVKDKLLYPLTIDDKQHQVLAMKIINLVAQTYLMLAWIVPSAFLFMVSNILAWQFNCNAAKLQIMQRNSTTDYVERIRKNHQKLCNLVKHADSIFSMHIAMTFLGSLTLICLNLYEMILVDDVGILYRCIQVYWLANSGFKILIDCLSGARLNQAVSTRQKLTLYS